MVAGMATAEAPAAVPIRRRRERRAPIRWSGPPETPSGDRMQKWLKAYLLTLIVVGAASAYVVLASSFFDLLGRYFGLVWAATTILLFVLFVMLPAFLYGMEKSRGDRDGDA